MSAANSPKYRFRPLAVNSLSPFIALFVLAGAVPTVPAAESVIRPDDVIALVGGEDMAAVAEQGRLEWLAVRTLPDHKLRFRSLAREGDTVFQQARDLNYPSLEQQLDEIGATVVVAQFGQMESLAGESRIPEFTAAYEKLIDRLSSGGKRRVALLGPTPVSSASPALPRFTSLPAYTAAIRGIAQRRELRCLIPDDDKPIPPEHFRDGIHLNERGLLEVATKSAQMLGVGKRLAEFVGTDELRLADLIQRKNLLWFHYARPQNWAFLNGDRTVQPSSRDHLDPSIRWFPEEMKQWLPLIAAQETEIWNLARQLGAKK